MISPKIGMGLVVAVLFALLFVMLSYSSGYGQVIDGEVRFIRKPLVTHIVKDYRLDGGEWSFGYFVPVAVAGLFWLRRKELLNTAVEPALVGGGAFLVFGFLFYWAGYRGEQKYFGYAAGQILVLGTILWFLGWRWFGKLFWLWMLLGMMWPWRFLIERVSAPLQLIMIKLTSWFLNVVGAGAVASGSSLSTSALDPVTGDPIALDVHAACSGMRSLFALVMIGLVFSFLRVKEEWKRWVLMACVPLVAVAGNFVRILMLFGGSAVWGTDFAVGEGHEMSTFHLVAGLMVFVVALVLLSLMVAVMEGGWQKVFKRSKVVRREVSREVG
ncbi:exosortase/archaeosortase family protein [Roseibacillus ishigakijimensis]|nr:exosortase/archaeosortase family protein [Roseibacillus ishigakijimensis]